MDAPSFTPAQYGAGGLFGTIAMACIASGTTGTDLVAYLVTSAIVTSSLVIGDAVIRNGRARNACDVAHVVEVARAVKKADR